MVGREETPFAFLVPPSRCELLLVQIAFQLLGKNRDGADRESLTAVPETLCAGRTMSRSL
jgi:hypothetical protein